MDIPGTMDELRTWLAALDPIPRAKFLGLVLDRQHIGELGAIRREAVWQATEDATYAVVAEQLGVTVSTVNKARIEHKKTLA